MWWRWWILMAAAVALCSCATAPAPRVIVQKVEIPVAVNCVAEVSPDPAYADSPAAIAAAADVFRRVQLLLAGRAQRDARLAELVAGRAGCRAAGDRGGPGS